MRNNRPDPSPRSHDLGRRPGGPLEPGLLPIGEKGYQLLFEHMDSMVCTLDLAGRFTSVNRAGERLTGFRAEDLVGKLAIEVIAPELREEAVRQFQRRLTADADSAPDESVLVTQDGKRIPIEITSRLLTRNGRPFGVLGLVRDVTARKSTERALHRSEERFRALIEAAPDGVVIADADGRIALVNAQTEALFGYERDEMIGLPVELLLPEAVRSKHSGHRAAYLADPEVRQMGAGLDLAGRRKDGSEFPVDISLSPLRTDDGVFVVAAVRDVTERKSAEEALLESEQRFRSAFNFAPIGMALVAPDGRWLQVNDALCELVGYSAGELLSKTFQDLTHPDDLEADLELARQTLAGEIRTYQLEKRYLHKRGRVVWILLSVSLVRSSDGSPLYFVSQIKDITEQKRAEEAITRSEARLAEAQQIAHIGSWEWNATASDVATWSDELYRILGVGPESPELTYRRFLETVHFEDRRMVEEVMTKAYEAGEPFVTEYRIVVPDGTVRWIHGRGEVAKEDDGSVTLRATAQDITERKEAEERLSEAQDRYRTLVEQLPLVTYIRPLDMAAANVYASPQVEDVLGYSAAEWQTNPDLIATIVHSDDLERVLEAGEHVRRTGEPSRQEYRYIARDGRTVWVQDETYIVRDERGEPQSVQGYLLDITERKLAEEERDRMRDELHHSQKLEALGRLAGGVAHDFNNMLTAIKGYSELLLDTLESGSPARKEAEQIRRAAEQAAALPRELLAFSRKQVLAPRLVDLDEVILAAGDLLKRLAGQADVVMVPGTSSARVLADPSQLEQALLNLVLNARDAMPGGGRITISTRRTRIAQEIAAEHEVAPGAYAVISVSDTGHGMDAETKTRIFEPFFTTKQPGQGSGLGLSTVYGLVRQSGGFIHVESKLGRGSTFEMHFPCVEAEFEPGPASDEIDVQPASPATVMLVEDEGIVRDLAATALNRAGYRVLAAASAAEALVLCEQPDAAVDVLVTDMVMPGMGGRELAERVLAQRPETAVVLMSGYPDEAPVVDGADGSAPSFLEKPFSPRQLVQAVGTALEQTVPGGNGSHPREVMHDGSVGASQTITCLIADDHPAVLDAVSRFLEGHGIEVVSRVSRGDDALSGIEALRPSIALLDVGMEPLSGIEVARRAAEASPETRVVLYTGQRDSVLLEKALGAGAQGFVLKEAPLSELVRALGVVASGGTYVDPELSGALVSAQAVESLSPLTPREREVLGLLADGMTNEKVGGALGISAETVQSHVRNAMGKLEADTRTQAVATAIRQSFIS